MISTHIEAGEVSVRRRAVPRRPPGHARIRLLLAGICNTDVELVRGYYGFSGTPGHEFVGEVVECDTASWLGRRVVGEINLACGTCPACQAGLGRHCARRSVLGIVKHPGVFAESFTLPEENLHEVPAEVKTEHAVFTEPLAAACEILDQVNIPAGADVAVLGDGKLGLLAAQVLSIHGAVVKLYGRHPAKLAIAEAAGVHVEFSEKIGSTTYPFVVEATGAADGLRQAVAITRPRGTVVLKSTVHDEVELDMAPVIVNEITLVGSRCGRFEPALDLLRGGRLHLDEMISARYHLADAVAAFEKAQQRGVIKVLIEP
jgi:alcohol dehydrogenase